MEDRSWKKWELAGLFFAIGCGNALHFLYEWTGRSAVAAVLSSVNESAWEHMKLLAVPWTVWTLLEALAHRRGTRDALARFVGLLAGAAAIPVLYYTYRGITGENIDLVNILIFQLAVLASWGVTRLLRRRCKAPGRGRQTAGVLLHLALWGLFIWWTWAPPHLPLFCDPLSGTFGR